MEECFLIQFIVWGGVVEENQNNHSSSEQGRSSIQSQSLLHNVAGYQ
jgi:hypothetical protein